MLGDPYTPGAGCVPQYLAGREHLINAAELALVRHKSGYPQRSIIYYGLRGVGKTVLLNTIEQAAENMGIEYAHIEASEQALFLGRFINALRRFLRRMSLVQAAKELAAKCEELIASFTISYDLTTGAPSVEFSLPQSSAHILDDDVTEIMTTLGHCANRAGKAVCIFVDEFQFASENHIRALVTGLHRCNQLRLPVMLIGAGLPKLVGVVSNACSYSERIFTYELVDKLSDDEARAALVEPAQSLGVQYDAEAADRIVRMTQGYPYFIQEFGSVVWDSIDDCEKITLDMVDAAQIKFFERLDTGFFASRIARCARLEQLFMLAMAECGELPCNINDVARRMDRNVKQISPVRAKLINKGMIYATGRGELDFTVPLFADFLKRTVHILPDE